MIWLWAAIESDFLRTYGTDILPYVSGRKYMSVRRFFNMVSSLPDDSAYVRAINSKEWKNKIK